MEKKDLKVIRGTRDDIEDISSLDNFTKDLDLNYIDTMIEDEGVNPLKSSVLLHFYIGDIMDRKIINHLSKQYGVSKKYIIDMVDEINDVESKLRKGDKYYDK